MNTILALYSFSTNHLVNIFIWVAVLAVVVWGIIALVRWSGVVIHPVVRIVATVLGVILAILLLVKLFEALLV